MKLTVIPGGFGVEYEGAEAEVAMVSLLSGFLNATAEVGVTGVVKTGWSVNVVRALRTAAERAIRGAVKVDAMTAWAEGLRSEATKPTLPRTAGGFVSDGSLDQLLRADLERPRGGDGVLTGVTVPGAKLAGKALAALTRNLHKVSPVVRVAEEGRRKRPAGKKRVRGGR